MLRGEFRPGGSEREWCDPDVLRSLRRRSLARLRREVEPVPAATLGRFLPAWHGVGSESGSLDRLLEVVGQLEGLFLPWSVYERDVLAARVRGYQPRQLDELCAGGEVVWVGRGSLGTEDGRVALFRRERLSLLAPTTPEEPPDEPIHQRIRDHLAGRGASFFREIFSAAGGPTDAVVLEALWALVWSGELTNDTLTPLRLRLLRKTKTRRPGHLARIGPPEAAGRWSLVPTLSQNSSGTERAHAIALSLLERHGVVTRESVLGEGVPGGFASVYPVLRAMEEAGKIRRGYFVEGLGAAQFSLPGAVDRLRAERTPIEGPTVQVLAAADPANPYGATLAWPKFPNTKSPTKIQRVGGAYVILVDGEPALYVERSHKGLVVLPAFEQYAPHAIGGLRRLAETAPRRELAIERVDGETVLGSPLRPLLEQAGFNREYLGPDAALVGGGHPSSSGAECLKATPSFRRPPRCGRSWSGAPFWPRAHERLARDRTRRRQLGNVRRAAGQTHADPLRQWTGPAHPSAHGGHLAPLRAGRAVEDARLEGARRPGSAGARRGVLQRARRRVDGRAGGRAAPRAPGARTDLLGAEFPTDVALQRLKARPELEIAEALLDQRAMAGVGNVFKSEVLFIESVHPWTHVSALDDATLERLIATARRLLLDNVRPGQPHRVTTRGDPSASGSLWVYGRANLPCTRCRTPIQTRRQGQLNRPTYWCPGCQPPC